MDQLEEQISKFSLLLTGSSSRPLPETETFLLSLVCRQCFLDKKIPCFWKFKLYGPLAPNQLLKDHETDLALLGLPTLPHHSRREG